MTYDMDQCNVKPLNLLYTLLTVGVQSIRQICKLPGLRAQHAFCCLPSRIFFTGQDRATVTLCTAPASLCSFISFWAWLQVQSVCPVSMRL